MYRTPISILQELMVQRKERIPDYYIENYDGLPGVSFMCTVKIGQLKAVGFASTKKDAKQYSAEKALELLGHKSAVQQQMSSKFIHETMVISQKNCQYINYVGQLNEYASTHGKPYPNYIDEITASNGMFATRCHFLQWMTEGYGIKKKDSKQDAARRMLNILKTEEVPTITKKMESLELNKIKEINTLSQEILKKYEKLSSSANNVVVPKFVEFKPIPNLKRVSSMEELKTEMKKFGYSCTLKTFQESNPCIVMLKINDTEAVLMGKGDTREEAIHDLFEMAFYMFSQGFTLNTEL